MHIFNKYQNLNSTGILSAFTRPIQIKINPLRSSCLRHLIFVCVLLSISNKGLATTYTSAMTGDWNTAATWTPVGVPGAGDDVIITLGHIVTISDIRDITSMTVEPNCNLVIEGTLNMNGTMDLGGTIAVIGTLNTNGVTYVLSSGFLNGPGTWNLNGTNSFSGTSLCFEVSTLNLNTPGTLTGSAEMSICTTCTMNWYQDTHITLSTTFVNYSTINTLGAGFHTFTAIENLGSINRDGGNMVGGQLFNSGAFYLNNDGNTDITEFINENFGFIEGGGNLELSNITNKINAEIIVLENRVMNLSDIVQIGVFEVIGTLNMTGGQYDLQKVSSFSGSGTLNIGFNNGNCSITSSTAWEPQIPTINLLNGINGSPFFIIPLNTVFNWHGNSNIDFGTGGSVKNNGTVNIIGTGGHGLSCPFDNYSGFFQWSGGDFGGTGLFRNIYASQVNCNSVGGSWTSPIENNAFFNSNVNCSINSGFTNTNSGVLNIAAGVLTVTGGFSNAAVGAILKGNGTLTANVSGSGSIQPGASPGTLVINGNYSPGALVIELEENMGIVTKDSLFVNGNVDLSFGTLNLTTAGTIPPGSYTILKATGGTFTGQFNYVGDPCYTVEYGSDFVLLKLGVTKTWSGLNGSWSLPAEWSPYGVPCPDDDVVIPSGIVTLDVNPDVKSITINGGQLDNSAGSFTIAAPTIIAAAASCKVNQPLSFTGNLEINGKIKGNSIIDISAATMIGGYGTWAPGNSAGTLGTTGTYDNEVIEMEIQGPTNGTTNVEHDILNVSDNMKVSGKIEVSWLGGTVPPATRTIMECDGGPGCRTQQFSVIVLPPECNGGCSIEYTDTQVRLRNDVPIEFIGVCTWTGATNSDWNTFSNWSCNDVPNANDDVIINGGTVTLPTSVTVKSLTLNGGTLSGIGSVNVVNNFNWTGGTLALIGASTYGSVNVSGNVTVASGELNMNQGGVFEDPMITLQEGNLKLPVDKNLEIGTGMILSTGTGQFTNNGSLKKTGTGLFTIESSMTIAGTLEVNEGILKFKKNLTNNGLIKGIGNIDLTQAQTVLMGNLAPGNSPGTLNITGNYTNQNLVIELEETGGNTTNDLLVVSQNAEIDNDLTIVKLGGNIPYGAYDFLSCNGTLPCRTGTFDNIAYPAFCAGAECTLIYTDNGVTFNFQAGLPVELTRWFGFKKDNAVALNWATESEVNTDKFIVQRLSQNNWENIGSLRAKGNTNSESIYGLMDQFPLIGSNLYRLEIIDLDGTIHYSPIISIEFESQKAWKIYPNPVSNMLSLNPGRNSDGVFQIFNSSGILLKTISYTTKEIIQIDVSEYPAGLYGVCIPGISCQLFLKQ